MAELAINGGTPVRTAPLPSAMQGATLIGEEELKELADVVREQSPFRFYGLGNPDKVDTLEKMVCEKFGVKHALGVSSGTSSITVAVAALGLGAGDEVILPAFAWFSDFTALVTAGVKPVFADVGPDINLDPEDFERKITPATKAVIAVHYQGTACRMDEIMDVARRHGIYVIEDIAQAFGGKYKGKYLGTIGDIAVSSFQTHKVITAGEGGMVLTNSDELYIRAVRYHDLGMVRDYFFDKVEDQDLLKDELSFAGGQFRMNELTGAFLCAQFRRVDRITGTCWNYKKRLCDFMKANYPQYPLRGDAEGDCGILFGFLLPTKEEAQRLREIVTAEGIDCSPTSACCNLMHEYPIKTKAMANPANPPFGPGCSGEDVVYDAEKDCLHCDDYHSRFFCVSIGVSYTEQDVDDILEALKKGLAAL